MSAASLLGALGTAGLLGLTHAVEPDHVAGISSLAGRTPDPRRSVVVGASFALGHVLLVVAWLALVAAVVHSGALPSGLDALGEASAATLLVVFGSAMAVSGFRAVVRTGSHSHGEVSHAHAHLHLPLPGFDAGEHDHGAVGILRTGVVGALFALSPPLSMLAFASALLPHYGAGVVTLAVCAYAVSITAAMGAIGAGTGSAFAAVERLDARTADLLRGVVGVAVVALALTVVAPLSF
ncbi:MAG: hypothetical protein ABEJ31_11355 [Haloarculaceae archaeon]